ncbi:MAG: replicative DNA helicase [Acidobacteriota bacterium]
MANELARVLPQNVDAEKGLLGAILLNNDGMLTATDHVTEEDFSRESHRQIWAGALRLFKRSAAIDLVTLPDELEQNGVLEKVGGISYIASLIEGVPRALNVEHYARIVKDKSILRQLIRSSEEIQDSAYRGLPTVDDVLAGAEKKIFAIAEKELRSNFTSMAELMTRTAQTLEELYKRRELVTGLPTGFREFDEMTTGLQPSDLIIVAARPSVGKTSFCLGLAQHAALKHGKVSAVFSLEMSKEQIAIRMICSEARVDLRRLRSGYLTQEEIGRIAKAMGLLSQAKIFVDDSSAATTLEMRSKARRLKAEHGLDLIVIDYLQLISEPGYENRNLEISAISRSLKALAKELQVPVMALSQLSRAPEARKDRKPQLSDLRESGSLEQDADLVAFLVREEMYNEEAEQGVAELIIGKQRNGPTGSIKLAFIREYTRFENLEWKPPA